MPEISGQLLLRAIRAYIELAYPSGQVPANRRHFAEIPDDAPLKDVLAMKGIEILPPQTPAGPCGYALRVGCEWYAHTKILLRAAGGEGPLTFSVDTHDQLIVPAGPAEEEAVRRLKERNTSLARAVEERWTKMGIPTQVAELRRFLDHARAAGQHA